MIRIGLRTLALALPALAPLAGAAASPGLPEVIEFNRHIRPIMSNTCFRCHGPDVKNNKSTLRLDLPDSAYAPHKNAKGRVTTPIVPGKPEMSEVWRRISSTDQGEIMPPADSLHQLTDRDKALFKRWIEQGAKYEAHWAYLAPVKREPPAVSGNHARGVRNEIDRFIRAELAAHNLQPSPGADRRTLIRRVSLDLLGLPPTPDEVEAFVADTRPGAYERLVDRLLTSVHFGERMAVPWLDLVRFADTVGFHGDQRQNIFPYRDYVIDAFNRNKPFDQFTIEQIAGDLLPNATDEQKIASGYNRLNMMTREGGAQPKEYLAKYAADRVRTVSTAFLGSTLACAECHDHKFDPFSTRDFYAMAAYFADIKQYGVYNDYKYTPEPELEGFSNDYPFPPEIEVENEALQRRLAGLRAEFDARNDRVAQALLADADGAAAVSQWASQVAPRLKADPGGWAVASIEGTQPHRSTLAATLPDQSVRFEDVPVPGKKMKAPAKKETVVNVLTLNPPSGPLATVRLQALPDDVHGGRVARDDEDRFELSLKLAVLRAGQKSPQALEIADAYPDGHANTYFNAYLLTSVRKRWTSAASRATEAQAVDYVLRQPVSLEEGDRLIATITSADVGRVRISVSPLGGRLPTEEISPAEIAAFHAEQPSLEQRTRVAARYFLSTGAADAAEFAEALENLREIAACREGKAFTMVTVATEPAITRVLARGNWQDETGEIVRPEPPRFLMGAPKAASASAAMPRVQQVAAALTPQPAPPPSRQAAADSPRQNRLDLARWIVSRENPLTARTFVNRLWKQFFGTGLSAVVDDLGRQGEYPSHPDLLDWLAVEFVDRGWDVKAIVKLIVTSATYRQSSTNRPELREIDPDNRLLARQSARRLEAEFVRDNALSAAGLLNLEVGGPSATPYQPEDYYAQLNFPLREYEAETDERQYRRGVYMHWQRTFVHPMLANFDAPSREECTAARTVSSTPQQALTLLNDPTFVEAARVLAEQVLLREPDADFAAQLEHAFVRVLARPPAARETESLRAHHDAQLAYYTANPGDAKKLADVGLQVVSPEIDRVKLAAWTSVARVLLNLNESIVIY